MFSTGASLGIDLETAELFYNLGCNVAFIFGRKRLKREVPFEDNPRTFITNCNISNWDNLVEAFRTKIAKFGHVNIICPSAGVAEPPNQYFELDFDAVGKPQPLDLKVFDVGLKGTAYTMHLGIHHLKVNLIGGGINMMSSLAGYQGVPEMLNYTATKYDMNDSRGFQKRLET